MSQPATILSESPHSALHREAERAKTEAAGLAGEAVQPLPGVVIRLETVMSILWVAAAVIVLMSLVQDLLIFLMPEAGFSDRIYRLDLDTESSLPTWFSASLLLFASLLLALIAVQVNRESRFKALPWFLLTGIFCLLSLDEIATLHEWLSAAISAHVDNAGLFYFAWTVPALAVCIGGLICFVPFIFGFKGADRLLLLGSAIVFLSGAIGMEMLGGAEAEVNGIATFKYRLLSTLEEALEFAGVLLFLTFLLRHLRAAHGRTVLNFR